MIGAFKISRRCMRKMVWTYAENSVNTIRWLWMRHSSQRLYRSLRSKCRKRKTASLWSQLGFLSNLNLFKEVNEAKTESCRDCANLEDRRDIEGVALCAMHHGPSVSCQEFKPKNLNVNTEGGDKKFCLNCVNFEEIGGTPICARDHRPGIACGAFKSREEEKLAVSGWAFSKHRTAQSEGQGSCS
jgi:hypothetical protein